MGRGSCGHEGDLALAVQHLGRDFAAHPSDPPVIGPYESIARTRIVDVMVDDHDGDACFHGSLHGFVQRPVVGRKDHDPGWLPRDQLLQDFQLSDSVVFDRSQVLGLHSERLAGRLEPLLSIEPEGNGRYRAQPDVSLLTLGPGWGCCR